MPISNVKRSIAKAALSPDQSFNKGKIANIKPKYHTKLSTKKYPTANK